MSIQNKPSAPKFAERLHAIASASKSVLAPRLSDDILYTHATALGTHIELLQVGDPRLRQMALSKLEECCVLLIASIAVGASSAEEATASPSPGFPNKRVKNEE